MSGGWIAQLTDASGSSVAPANISAQEIDNLDLTLLGKGVFDGWSDQSKVLSDEELRHLLRHLDGVLNNDLLGPCLHPACKACALGRAAWGVKPNLFAKRGRVGFKPC